MLKLPILAILTNSISAFWHMALLSNNTMSFFDVIGGHWVIVQYIIGVLTSNTYRHFRDILGQSGINFRDFIAILNFGLNYRISRLRMTKCKYVKNIIGKSNWPIFSLKNEMI